MKIVLASASPRRKDLLRMIGISDFEVIPSENEEIIPSGASPEETVRAIALSKARNVAAKLESDALVIAADTLVYLDGRPLGKPSCEEDAKSMLRLLSGNRHTVFTGVAMSFNGRELTAAEASDVYFRSMSDKEIDWYVLTGEPMDKAGAYGLQGLGSVFVHRIDGDMFNIIGLPVCRLCLMLREFGIDIADGYPQFSER